MADLGKLLLVLLLGILIIPVALILYPDLTLSHKYLSTAKNNVLGVSPGGSSSGNSCNLKDC